MPVLIVSRLNQAISEEKEVPEFQTQPTDDASQTSKRSLLPAAQRLPDVVVPKISKTGKSRAEEVPWLRLIDVAGKKYYEIEPANQKTKVETPAKRCVDNIQYLGTRLTCQ